MPITPTGTSAPGTFAIEAWVRWAAAPSTFTGILTYYHTSTNQRSWTLQWEPGDSLTLWVTSNGSTRNSISRAWAPVLGQWYHVAGTRSGNAFRCYLDGQPSAALTWGTSLHVPTGVALKIGSQPGLHIDEVRITKGVARFGSSAFTPPAAAFPEGVPSLTQRQVVIVAA